MIIYVPPPRRPEHQCDLPFPSLGELHSYDRRVAQCEECGTWWEYAFHPATRWTRITQRAARRAIRRAGLVPIGRSAPTVPPPKKR